MVASLHGGCFPFWGVLRGLGLAQSVCLLGGVSCARSGLGWLHRVWLAVWGIWRLMGRFALGDYNPVN
jgi:hypothetical protein